MEGEEISLDPQELARLLEDGRIPPSALVLENGRWVRVGESALLPRPAATRLEPMREAAGLGAVLFPRRSLSATEGLLLVNIAVMAVLLVLLRGEYLIDVRTWVVKGWHAVRDRDLYAWWIPTLFMHADLGHLGRNMVSLLGSAGAVEFLLGRTSTVMLYLGTGLCGAALSYLGHGRPPLSIGASGAVLGLFGVVVGYLLRNYRTFDPAQRWKARRVYAPLLVILVAPSLFNADWMAHVGGFAGGVIGGLAARRRKRADT
jgi:membrane associated rhomboid family serine protease